MLTRAKYSATFEFMLKPPVTIKGVTVGSTLKAMTTRAFVDAMKQAKGRIKGWTSYVIVIDRYDFMNEEERNISPIIIEGE